MRLTLAWRWTELRMLVPLLLLVIYGRRAGDALAS